MSNAGNAGGAFNVIGPEDVLSITVQRHPEFSLPSVIVTENGTITVPVAGTVRAAGKTTAQLDAELTKKFKVRLLRPDVIVSIVSSATRPVYVVGEVKVPGVLAFRKGWRITQALAASGGISVDPEMAAVAVSRDKRVVADVPLLPILRNPSGPQNLELRVGDTLRFYERVVNVAVSGAVNTPGAYRMPRGSGVMEAIGLAGGPTESASLTRATLRRSDGTTVPINLFNALRLGQKPPIITLRAGDILNIPAYTERVSLLGAVKTPGFYGLEDGRSTRIADVIARAGGVAEGAALTRATLRRGDGEVVPLNLYRLLVLGENDNNLTLAANDVLTIPESRGITVLGEVGTPGTFKIEEGLAPRASDALARAGGTTIKPELARISVARTLPGGKSVVLSLDPVGLLDLSSPEQNTLLQDGDIISVSAVKLASVTIGGLVKTPGNYPVKEGDGLTSLLAQAGSQTEDASLSQVVVTSRDGQSKTVDANPIVRGAAPDIVLRDGDKVFIPRNNNRILVAGAVNEPNSYPLPEDRVITIAEALGMAKGATAGGGAKEIVVWRETPRGLQRIALRTDKPIEGQFAYSQKVQKGDVILVPEAKTSNRTLGLVNSFLPALSFFLR
ncbi:MAG: SLBB domain-containing protein [Armatimonadetes bacterium]|nr:SLBB domain-containing protein [Armatimonadota bacterium]